MANKKHNLVLSLLGVAVVAASMLFVYCAKDNPAKPTTENNSVSWTFSGTVVDGATGLAMANVKIAYIDVNQEPQVDTTNSSGAFSIPFNPPGQRNFTFTAPAMATATDTIQYTVKTESQSGIYGANDTVLLDVSKTVALFPLSATISGTVVAQKNKRSALVPAAGVTMSVSFMDSAMADVSPRAFSVVTDSTGAFSIAKMPAGTQATLAVANITIGGVDYKLNQNISNVKLLAKAIPLGTFIMTPVDTSFALLSVLPKVVVPGHSIALTYSEPIDTPNYSYATLQGNGTSGNVNISAVVSGATLTLTPAAILRNGQKYLLTVYAFGKMGGQATDTSTLTVNGGDLTDITASNILDGNKVAIDGLGLSDSITFTFRDSVTSATINIENVGVIVPSTTTIAGKTVIIKPTTVWPVATLTVKVSATLKDGTPVSFNFAEVTNNNIEAVKSSNVLTSNGAGLTNVAVTTAPSFVMAVPFDSASLGVTMTNPAAVNISFTSKGDTITVTTPQNLSYNTPYTVTIKGKTKTSGLSFSVTVGPFTTVVGAFEAIKSSNVLTSDFAGLTNVAVNTVPSFVMAIPFDSASLGVTLVIPGTPPTPVNAQISSKADTIWVHPPQNLNYSGSYAVVFSGKTKTGLSFNFTSNTFTTQPDVFAVASNTWDASGNNAVNFPIYGTMWVKFSEPLSTDSSKIVWSAAAGVTSTLIGDKSQATYNSSIRISGDTLFVTPLKSLVNINFGDIIGFKVQVATASGKIASVASTFKATIQSNGFSVLSTNTKDAFGDMRTDFGILDTVRVVFNQGIAKINTATYTGLPLSTVGVGTINDLKLNATGDTLTFVPPVKLTNDVQYTIAITNVDLTSGLKNVTTAVSITWKTIKGIRLVSANDMTSATVYRPFSVTGDSLVLTFSEPVDITKAFNVFPIGSLWAHAQYSWNAAHTVVTIKGGPQDTLKAKAYVPVPDYSINAATVEYAGIQFQCTPVSTETQVTLNSAPASNQWVTPRAQINVHTVNGIELLNTNLIEDANVQGPYTNAFNTKVSALGGAIMNRDSMGLKDTITLVFSRAVDSAKIFGIPSNYLLLQKGGVGAALNFTMSISADKQTVKLVPADSLKQTIAPAQSYTLTLSNIPAAGLEASLQGGKVLAYSLPFTTTPLPGKMLTKEAIGALSTDTSTTAGVRGKYMPYSPVISAYNTQTLKTTVQNHVYFYFNEVCWNAHHDDSITHYQAAVQGYDGGWIELGNSLKLTQTGVYTPWNTPSAGQRVLFWDLNLAAATDLNGQSVLSLLQKPNGGNGYSNPATDIFNNGNVIKVKIRPIYSTNATFEYANDQYGAWSDSISYTNNVAPCDSDFVAGLNVNAAAVAAARLINTAQGGVSVTPQGWVDTNLSANPSLAGGVRATVMNDGGYYVTVLTFPEDMDTSAASAANIKATVWMGDTTGLGANTTWTKDATYSKWSSARSYTLVLDIPHLQNYLAHLPYYAISINQVKNASGVVIQAYGTTGDAATGTTWASINAATVGRGKNDADKGPNNLIGLTAF
ncbi:MAG: carboxypeptidase-like regulatory domain-containing protein [Chitinivibrionales bacterium]|nr:carboxypeptidase-like regulatory domain-containing protein [Chitinivibrionales bacterium]